MAEKRLLKPQNLHDKKNSVPLFINESNLFTKFRYSCRHFSIPCPQANFLISPIFHTTEKFMSLACSQANWAPSEPTGLLCMNKIVFDKAQYQTLCNITSGRALNQQLTSIQNMDHHYQQGGFTVHLAKSIGAVDVI